MKKEHILLLVISSIIILSVIISKMMKRGPKLKAGDFTIYDNGLPVLHFEIDGDKMDYIDGHGNGSGTYKDNTWAFTRFNGTDYLVSAYNEKTGAASAILIKRPANIGNPNALGKSNV